MHNGMGIKKKILQLQYRTVPADGRMEKPAQIGASLTAIRNNVTAVRADSSTV